MIDHDKFLPRILEKMFPDPEIREQVVDILEQYGRAEFHKEFARVKIAILKLSGKSPEQVRYFTLMACRDYRDVLASAEYPNEMGYYPWRDKDPERLAEIQAKDKEQYQSWCLGVLWERKSADS